MDADGVSLSTVKQRKRMCSYWFLLEMKVPYPEAI